MTAHPGYSSYSVSSAKYASPGMQVAMLLAAAARHMETARDCINNGDIEGRFNATEKCAQIVSGLRGCLNRENPEAAEMTNVLDTYYGRTLTFLTQINVRNDLELCEKVAESLRTMSSTWREVQARADAEARASMTGAAQQYPAGSQQAGSASASGSAQQGSGTTGGIGDISA